MCLNKIEVSKDYFYRYNLMEMLTDIAIYSNNSFENGFQGWTLSNLFGGANSAEIICNPAGSIGRSVPDGDCYAKLVENVSNT